MKIARPRPAISVPTLAVDETRAMARIAQSLDSEQTPHLDPHWPGLSEALTPLVTQADPHLLATPLEDQP